MSVKGDWKRPTQVSQEELDLRWEYAFGKLNITEEEMRQRIEEIRKRTGKP